ncbi:MAG TPA: acyl-CoA thioesterase [Bacteroidia bacterium]|jgi:acyl-CoA thioester hydrolase|nr:acyl-CoA thioesterase [Bacteroidia bacterium]
MLKNTIEIPVRFSEVDSLRVVWHGHYLKYFEDGREAFGKQYGFSYLDIFNAEGLAVPIVDVQTQFKRPLEYGDSVIIETTFINTPAAKIIFDFKIFSKNHDHLVCEGKTTQVFMRPATQELYIVNPPFVEEWKKKYKLL